MAHGSIPKPRGQAAFIGKLLIGKRAPLFQQESSNPVGSLVIGEAQGLTTAQAPTTGLSLLKAVSSPRFFGRATGKEPPARTVAAASSGATRVIIIEGGEEGGKGGEGRGEGRWEGSWEERKQGGWEGKGKDGRGGDPGLVGTRWKRVPPFLFKNH